MCPEWELSLYSITGEPQSQDKGIVRMLVFKLLAGWDVCSIKKNLE